MSVRIAESPMQTRSSRRELAHLTRRGLLSTIVEGSQTLYLWEVDQAIARHAEAMGGTDEAAAGGGATGMTARAKLGAAAAGEFAAGGGAGAPTPCISWCRFQTCGSEYALGPPSAGGGL